MAETRSLEAVEILQPLTPAERRAVAQRCRWKSWSPDEQIIDRDTDSNDVYFVASGSARVVMYGLTGREVTFDDVPPGGSFGELAAIDGGKRSANVVAVQPTVTAALSATAFRELLAAHPPVALACLRRLARIVRASTGRIMDLSTLGANNRIYAELLRLARSSDAKGGGNEGVLRPIPVHSDIAARVSTTRETVARVLSDLQRKHLVRRDKDALVIADLARLSAMVEQFHD